SDDLIVQGNLVVATAACNNGIAVRSESSAVSNISLRDNQITAQDTGKWENGIHLLSDPDPIQNLSITGNSINGAKRGIFLEGDKYEPVPLCALNQVAEDVKVPFLGLNQNHLNHLIAGGVTSRSGGRLIVGIGSPEGSIQGNVGDIFQQLDGESGATLWV